MKQTVSGWWVIWLILVNAHFSVSFAINSLIRSNVFWKTMMVDKVFCKSTNGSLDSSSVSREDKFTYRISIYFSKKNMLSISWWGIQCNQPATKWLTCPPRECRHTGDSRVGLCCWLCAPHWSQAGWPHARKFTLLSSYRTSLPPLPLYWWAHWAILGVAGSIEWIILSAH